MNACPLCNGLVNQRMDRYSGDAAIVKCGQCGHIFTAAESSADSGDLYDDGDYRVTEVRGTLFSRILELEHKAVLKTIGRIRTGRGRLLDFGCGKGMFLWLAGKAGWSVRGIETAPKRAAYAAQAYGLNVSTQDYTGGVIDGAPFDVITLFHVLEHLPAPSVTLGELLGKNLAPDGLVVLEVPNITSWQAKLAGAGWMQLDAPRHRSHFGKETLARLVRGLGFSVIKYRYFSFHLGVLGMINSLMSLAGYRKNALFELKNNRTKKLLAVILLLLPAGFIMESLSCCFGSGGVIRIYAERSRRA